jgi:hypothetical protein
LSEATAWRGNHFLFGRHVTATDEALSSICLFSDEFTNFACGLAFSNINVNISLS